MGNLVFIAVLGLTAAFFYWETDNFPQSLLSASSSPELFPRIILACILGLCVLMLLRDFRKRTPFVFRELFTGKTGIIAAALPAYLLGVQWLGFCPASFAMLLGLFCVLAPRPLSAAFVARSAALSALLAGGVFYLFTRMFHILLPIGPLGC